MEYQFIQWSNNTSINGDKVYAMAKNDDYLYDKGKYAPRGILLYVRKNSTYSLASASGTFTGFTGSFAPRINSLLKCSLYIPNVATGDNSSTTVRLDVKFNSTTVASTYFETYSPRYYSVWTSPSQLQFYYSATSSSSVSFTLDYASIGANLSFAIHRGLAFIVEDYGDL